MSKLHKFAIKWCWKSPVDIFWYTFENFNKFQWLTHINEIFDSIHEWEMLENVWNMSWMIKTIHLHDLDNDFRPYLRHSDHYEKSPSPPFKKKLPWFTLLNGNEILFNFHYHLHDKALKKAEFATKHSKFWPNIC